MAIDRHRLTLGEVGNLLMSRLELDRVCWNELEDDTTADLYDHAVRLREILAELKRMPRQVKLTRPGVPAHLASTSVGEEVAAVEDYIRQVESAITASGGVVEDEDDDEEDDDDR